MKAGKKVRGFFGQGAKDALAGMIGGKICTFKDEKFTECKLFIENGKPTYHIEDTISATRELRKEHEINENGTIAYFKAHSQKTGTVPKINTVHKEIANNYLLRKIMTNSERKVFLFDRNLKEKKQLRYQRPKGKEILSDDFYVSYNEPISKRSCKCWLNPQGVCHDL